MVKRRAKKPATNNVDPVVQRKLSLLQELLTFVQAQKTEYEDFLQTSCTREIEEIKKVYLDALFRIPDNIKKMTVAEVQVMVESNNERPREMAPPPNTNTIRSTLKERIPSEKKKTLKKDKRSCSASSSHRKVLAAPLSGNAPLRISRACSEPDMYTTPARAINNTNVITPKFDIRNPLMTHFARKPKAGEMIVSISGSPIRNVFEEKPSGHNVSLGLCNGKIVTLNVQDLDDKQKTMNKESEKNLDDIMENIKKQLQNIKQA